MQQINEDENESPQKKNKLSAAKKFRDIDTTTPLRGPKNEEDPKA